MLCCRPNAPVWSIPTKSWHGRAASDKSGQSRAGSSRVAARRSEAKTAQALAADEDRRQHRPPAHGVRLEVPSPVAHLGGEPGEPAREGAQRGEEQQDL